MIHKDSVSCSHMKHLKWQLVGESPEEKKKDLYRDKLYLMLSSKIRLPCLNVATQTRMFTLFFLFLHYYLKVNKGVTMVDLLSFARDLEAQTDLMVRTTWCYYLGWSTNVHPMQLHSVSLVHSHLIWFTYLFIYNTMEFLDGGFGCSCSPGSLNSSA